MISGAARQAPPTPAQHAQIPVRSRETGVRSRVVASFSHSLAELRINTRLLLFYFAFFFASPPSPTPPALPPLPLPWYMGFRISHGCWLSSQSVHSMTQFFPTDRGEMRKDDLGLQALSAKLHGFQGLVEGLR